MYLAEALFALSLVDDLVALALPLEVGARSTAGAGVVSDAGVVGGAAASA